MTEENTLPEGWKWKNVSYGSGMLHMPDGKYICHCRQAEAVRIARALSAPSIEDAKAAFVAMMDDPDDHKRNRALCDVIEVLDNLAPTTKPDLTQNLIRWDLLSKEVQDAFAALPKEAVQQWNGENWVRQRGPGFYASYVYRQNPEPLTKPDVPWGVLADDIINIVKVATGPNEWTLIGCMGIPLWDEDRQRWMGGNSCRMLPLSEIMSIDPGTCHPRDSLVMRPKEST